MVPQPALMLESIRHGDDPRIAVAVLSLLGERVESEYFTHCKDAPQAAPQSPMVYSREELDLRPLVERWLHGEVLAFPVPIHAPTELTSQESRRWSVLDHPWAKKILAGHAR